MKVIRVLGYLFALLAVLASSQARAVWVEERPFTVYRQGIHVEAVPPTADYYHFYFLSPALSCGANCACNGWVFVYLKSNKSHTKAMHGMITAAMMSGKRLLRIEYDVIDGVCQLTRADIEQ